MMNGANQIQHVNVQFENAVRNYLFGYAKEHEEWKTNLVKENKNMIDCVNYIMQEAKKQAVNGVCVMADTTSEDEKKEGIYGVYDLAVRYFEDDSIVVEEEKKTETPIVQAPATKPAKKTKKEDETPTFDFFATEKKEDDKESVPTSDNEDSKVIEMSVEIPTEQEKASAEGRAVAMIPDSALNGEKNTEEEDEDIFDL